MLVSSSNMAAARCLDSSTGFIVWDLRRSISLTLVLLSVLPQSLGASQRQAVTVAQLLVSLAGAEGRWPFAWASADRLDAVQWDTPRPVAQPDGVGSGSPVQRSGRVRLVAHGESVLDLCGDDRRITRAWVSFSASTSPPVPPQRFQAEIHRQFPASESILRLSHCLWLDGFAGTSVYVVCTSSPRPIVVAIMTDSGGSMSGSQSTTFMLASHPDPAWTCAP